jgi:hypothetical protein
LRVRSLKERFHGNQLRKVLRCGSTSTSAVAFPEHLQRLRRHRASTLPRILSSSYFEISCSRIDATDGIDFESGLCSGLLGAVLLLMKNRAASPSVSCRVLD